jgi:hypothetical protein
MQRRSTRHAPHREQLQRRRFTRQLRLGPRTVDLTFLPWLVALGYTNPACRPSHLLFPGAHILAHRSLLPPFVPTFRSHTMRGQMRCALWRCLSDALRSAARMVSTKGISGPTTGRSRSASAPRRFRADQRLPHHRAINPQLPGDPLDGSDSELLLPPYLLEQLHLRSPLHLDPPASQFGSSCLISRMLRSTGWANLEHQSRPNQTIKYCGHLV